MRSILSILAIVALTTFAVPAMAQQETNTGQDKPTQGQQAGDQGMTNDTSAVGRERTGVATETTTPTQTTEPSQVTPPTTQTAEPTEARENVTERAATTQEREEGGAMPTTGSSLPGLALVGVLLIAAGVGLRYIRGRS
jgi:cobalamin biosynthesis Mg chelatase CobN